MSRRNFIRNSGTILATGLILPGALSAAGSTSKNQQLPQAVFVGNTGKHPLFSGGDVLHLAAANISSIVLEKAYLAPLISGKSARRFVITDKQGNSYTTCKLVIDSPDACSFVHSKVALELPAATLGFKSQPHGKVQQQVKLWIMNPKQLNDTIVNSFLGQPQTAVMSIV